MKWRIEKQAHLCRAGGLAGEYQKLPEGTRPLVMRGEFKERKQDYFSRTPMKRFFVNTEQLLADRISVTGAEARHIVDVLRLRAGERIRLLDGTGAQCLAEIEATDRDRVDCLILERSGASDCLNVRLVVAQALLKAPKMDELVRKMTELGVAAWVPFVARRSVPLLDSERLGRRNSRWERIVREAAKQCKRSIIPPVGPCLSFRELIETSASYDAKIVFREKETEPLSADLKKKVGAQGSVLVVIGPEGGFEREEIEHFARAGFQFAGLGPRTLRAETAAIAACTLVQYLVGDMAT
ncbi:RsmE family RNA methyltransferase [Thermodesulfobacteriota bacterium]